MVLETFMDFEADMANLSSSQDCSLGMRIHALKCFHSNLINCI